mgnify:CR=1 FL=1
MAVSIATVWGQNGFYKVCNLVHYGSGSNKGCLVFGAKSRISSYCGREHSRLFLECTEILRKVENFPMEGKWANGGAKFHIPLLVKEVA